MSFLRRNPQVIPLGLIAFAAVAFLAIVLYVRPTNGLRLDVKNNSRETVLVVISEINTVEGRAIPEPIRVRLNPGESQSVRVP